MKKYLNIAFTYAILAMASGVFFREFTRLNGFIGRTSLSSTHLHLFVLGTVIFLILALFSLNTNLLELPKMKCTLNVYNIGLIFMVTMFYVRGITQVLELDLSKGANAAISGIAGIAHITLGTGIVMLFLNLKKLEKLK